MKRGLRVAALCLLICLILLIGLKGLIPLKDSVGRSLKWGKSGAVTNVLYTHKDDEKVLATMEKCRAQPLAGVYHSYRLTVIDPCKTVTGTVARIRYEQDGDYHLNLKLDGPFRRLINAMNKKYENGDLVVEVIPMDAGRIPLPLVGEHLTVTGSYVRDDWHGWMEIHPAWIINGKGSVHYTKTAAKQSVIKGVCGRGDFDCPKPSRWSWIRKYL